MDLLKCAKSILIEKEIDTTEENIKIVTDNLCKRERKRYNAVCIDIDGTLENVGETSDDILISLYSILNRHIPIVLITGRGESSLRSFYNNICMRLIKEKGINKELIKNIIAVTNNGSILFYTSEIGKNRLDNIENKAMLDKCNLLVKKEEIEKIKKIKSHLSVFLESRFNGITYSDSGCPSLGIDLVSFRIILDKEKDFDKMQQFIEYFLSSEKRDNNDSNIGYNVGKYREKKVIQINAGNKADAIRKVEQFLGIPENTMLRIGDRGDELGNDFSMLSCEQGYSVDICSNDINNCYPVCDENGDVLKGIEATSYLLSNARLFPTVCLKKPDKQRYTRQLALSERNINRGKKEIINNYNSIINNVFSISEGFEDIFDKKSGAIVFDDWQWNLIDDNNELKQLFNEKDGYGYKYSLDTDTSKLMRGADTYYYFLANKVKKEPDNELIISWYKNYMEFFKKAHSVLENYKINAIPEDLKLLLGVLDNIRNVSLINLNASIISEYPNNQSVLLSFNTYLKNNQIKEWFEICNSVYNQMENICFSKGDVDGCTEEVRVILEKVMKAYPKIVGDVLEKNDLNINKRAFRTYREIDNFIENFITMDLSIQNLKNENKNFLDQEINFSGLVYGGIELPLLAKNILSKEQCDIDTAAILIKKNSYDEMHSEEFFEKVKEQKIKIESRRNYERGFNIVSDDNVLTGVTLQAALELLFARDIYINNITVVRYPSINRIEHMFSKNRGAIDTSKFTTYIKGLIFPSPYSKVKNGEEYLDELGIFNKSRDRILRYLYKNGKYSKNSEADKIVNDTRRGDDGER